MEAIITTIIVLVNIKAIIIPTVLLAVQIWAPHHLVQRRPTAVQVLRYVSTLEIYYHRRTVVALMKTIFVTITTVNPSHHSLEVLSKKLKIIIEGLAVNVLGASSPSNITRFTGSKCFEAPDPATLPRPPQHWTEMTSKSSSIFSSKCNVLDEFNTHNLKLLLNVQW